MLAELDIDRRPVSLDDLLVQAPALTRVDRKYVVRTDTAQRLVDALPASYRVLTIGDRVVTTYHSTYFDTEDLATARAHVQRRRRRWKVRRRLYVEDGFARIEVKAKDGRGLTVKTVAATDADGSLGEDETAFLRETFATQGLTFDIASLRPTMGVSYRRATLARTGPDPARLTVDWAVSCRLDGRCVRLDDGHVLVETKGEPIPGDADRLLVRLGCRPSSFSKYVSAAALLRDDIADNDVRRMRGRLLHLEGAA